MCILFLLSVNIVQQFVYKCTVNNKLFPSILNYENVFQKANMNYSRAVKGALTRSGVIHEVKSQAQLELSRPLSKEEENCLFKTFSPQNVYDRAQKVSNFIFPYISPTNFVFSMVLEL